MDIMSSENVDRDASAMALMKFDYPSDDDLPTNQRDEKQVEDECEESAPSSFRLRIAEAQLTDSLSADNVDSIAEKTAKENDSFLAQMDSAIQNLHSWKADHSQESKQEEIDLEDEDHPETADAHQHDNILSQLTPRNDFELKEYSHSPEMLHKLESLRNLVHPTMSYNKNQDMEADRCFSRNLEVDMLRINSEAASDSSYSLNTAREMMAKELEMEMAMSGLSLSLDQATCDLDAILAKSASVPRK